MSIIIKPDVKSFVVWNAMFIHFHPNKRLRLTQFSKTCIPKDSQRCSRILKKFYGASHQVNSFTTLQGKTCSQFSFKMILYSPLKLESIRASISHCVLLRNSILKFYVIKLAVSGKNATDFWIENYPSSNSLKKCNLTGPPNSMTNLRQK